MTDELRKMAIRGWTEKARNRDQWILIVEEAKAHPGLQRRVEKEEEEDDDDDEDGFHAWSHRTDCTHKLLSHWLLCYYSYLIYPSIRWPCI